MARSIRIESIGGGSRGVGGSVSRPVKTTKGKPKPTAGKGIYKNIITKGGKAGRAIENKMRSEMKLPKLTTTGKTKAVAKVQKALDRTENRIPGNTQLKASIKNNKVVIKDEYMTKPIKISGSNKAAAKANVPKRTPGVKKNKSLQRSINNSNKDLKK